MLFGLGLPANRRKRFRALLCVSVPCDWLVATSESGTAALPIVARTKGRSQYSEDIKTAMKFSAEISHFRQLCCLGVDSRTVMPSLLQALHGLVGSHANSFYWAGRNRAFVNVYMEQLMPKDLLEVFFKEYLNNPNQKFAGLDLKNYLRQGQVIGNTSKVFPKTFYRSDVYNLIWRPQTRKCMLWARVFDAEGHINGVTLSRVVGDAEFSDGDEAMLLQLLPYFAHALNAPAESPGKMVEGGESAAIVVNRQGTVEHESAEGRRLLLLATHARVAPDSVDWRASPLITEMIQKLAKRVRGLGASLSMAPPVVEHENAWGKFVLRAYPMEACGESSMGLVVILIERQIPVKLKLLNAMQSMPLSTKQKEVCLLLSEGTSYQGIATRLGVRPNTIIDHVRKIYDKLDVRSHQELLGRLVQTVPPTRGATYH
jgi:DNA-binding CsgD family transcriptional regulator